MFTYILFIIGFVLLIRGAGLLVDGSSSIAKKLNIPSIVIGLTIVAMGTSAPELIVNIFSSATGNTDLAIGNILGSNIANILLILGVCSIIYPITTKKNTILKEIPFSLLAAVVVGVMANDYFIDGFAFSGITRIDGMVLLMFFVIFLYYTFGIAKIKDKNKSDIEIIKYTYTKSIIFVIFGLCGLTIGGKWIVDGAVQIASTFGLSQSLIGLTIVAIGTSLPELATSVVATYKKQTDIAIGNIVGSNIFNIFWILGVSSIIAPLPFSHEMNFDICMTILSSALLFVAMYIGRKRVLERWQGIVMVLLYFAYITFLILRG